MFTGLINDDDGLCSFRYLFAFEDHNRKLGPGFSSVLSRPRRRSSYDRWTPVSNPASGKEEKKEPEKKKEPEEEVKEEPETKPVPKKKVNTHCCVFAMLKAICMG